MLSKIRNYLPKKIKINLILWYLQKNPSILRKVLLI